MRRTHKSWQDFFLGSAVLGQYGHSVALEMAGRQPFCSSMLLLWLHRIAQTASCLRLYPVLLTCLALNVGLPDERLHIHHASICVWDLLSPSPCSADAMRNTGHFAAAYSGGWCVPPTAPESCTMQLMPLRQQPRIQCNRLCGLCLLQQTFLVIVGLPHTPNDV